METDTHKPEEGDHASRGETVVPADDLEQQIASLPDEEGGTREIHDDTNAAIERIRLGERVRAAQQADAARAAESAGDPEHVDSEPEWRLDSHTREIGHAGVAESRRYLKGGSGSKSETPEEGNQA